MIKQDMGKIYFHKCVFHWDDRKSRLKNLCDPSVFLCYINFTQHLVEVWHPPKSRQPSWRWRDLAGAAACVGLKVKSQRKYPGGNRRKGQWSNGQGQDPFIQNSEINPQYSMAAFGVVLGDLCWIHSERMAEWLWGLDGISAKTTKTPRPPHHPLKLKPSQRQFWI